MAEEAGENREGDSGEGGEAIRGPRWGNVVQGRLSLTSGRQNITECGAGIRQHGSRIMCGDEGMD